MKINFPLLALAIGAFGIGTTEFSPMGLLPVIAKGVDVSIPAAGMLISAYAIGVMVGAPLMTLLLFIARRNALIFLMAIFTLGNVLSSMAPDYTTLLISRIITSLNHGAFFGLGSVVAASVVPKHKQASAVATMFMGLTIANIGGVPAATWLGETIGWRMSFLATAGLGLVAMVSLWFSLPKGSAGERPNAGALRAGSSAGALRIADHRAGGRRDVYPLYLYFTGAAHHYARLAAVRHRHAGVDWRRLFAG
jgi:DHA1 family inner membrane transport protein